MFNFPQTPDQPGQPGGGPVYTVKLIADDEPYEPDMVKPFQLPQGNPKIQLHFNRAGKLIGFQVSGGPRPTIEGPPNPEGGGTTIDPRQKYNLKPGDSLFPTFKELLKRL